MTVIDVALEVIDDNPYNPRKHYPQAKVKEMAESLREVGLRQKPEGRDVGGRVQLAYGHMRKKGYLSNQKKDPEHWKTMPIDLKKISDQDMFHFAMEENLRRTDITPIEVARCIQAFSEMYPEVTEKEIGEKHSMTEANVSNMKRVLRLPELFLGKIDEGLITFTQGRELLTLEGLPDAKELMSSALAGINTSGNKSYCEPNTVEGLQRSIYSTIKGHFPPLDKEWAGYRWDLLFDTRAAGCLECDKMVRAHPTKSATAHFCSAAECWDRHDKEHREIAAAAAKATMETEVTNRAAQVIAEEEEAKSAKITERIERLKQATESADQAAADISQPAYTLEKRGPSWIALDAQGVVIAIRGTKLGANADAEAMTCPSPVATMINPDPGHYLLNHTYRFIEKATSRKLEFFDVTAQDLATAAEALGVDAENIELVKVWKSSGKAGTAGSVSAGWSKCTETLADISQEKSRPARDLPCDTCAKGQTCDRSFFHVADDDSGQLVCEQAEAGKQVVPEDLIEEDIGRRIAMAPAPAPQEIPEEVLAMAREKAGTRAEVLDLNDICAGSGYSRQIKQGYAILGDELRFIDDPEECSERCTHGFHYAFDSKAKEQREIHVCSDTKCLGQKKSAFTRAKNAQGQARKNAEKKAVKEAIAQTVTLDRPRIKLILLAQMDGLHSSRTYYYGVESGTKKPEKWLWDKLSAGTPENDRTRAKLFKGIDKLTDEELAQLVVELMIYYLVDHGDIGNYAIKVEEPLKWMGIVIGDNG